MPRCCSRSSPAATRSTRRASISRSPTTRRRSTRLPSRSGSASSASSSARVSTPRSRRPSARRSRSTRRPGRPSRRSRSRTRSTASPPITSSRRPSARATWPATTARSTATAPRTSRPSIPARRRSAAPDPDDDGQPGRGVRCRGQAADHARDVRPVGRLRRPVLQPGAEGPPPDPQRLRRRLPGGRRPDRPDLADARVQARREDRRPAGDVPLGHLHHHRQPRGYPRASASPAA